MPIRVDDFKVKGDKYVPPAVGVPGPSKRRDEVDEPDEKPEPKPPAVDPNVTNLTKTITALNEQVNGNAQNARLLADPEIRQLVEARDKGRKVRVVFDDEPAAQPKVEEIKPLENPEEATNAQLVDYMRRSIAGDISRIVSTEVTKAVGGLRKEIEPQLGAVQAAEQLRQQQAVQADLAALQKEFPDFEQMRPKMFELSKQVQVRNARQLYILAKAELGTPLATQSEVASERPSESPGQRSTKRRPTTTPGRQGFGSLVRNSFGSDETE